jgi:hypothetical protein
MSGHSFDVEQARACQMHQTKSRLGLVGPISLIARRVLLANANEMRLWREK